MQSMLAIARPNPSPLQSKRSSGMLRRIPKASSRAQSSKSHSKAKRKSAAGRKSRSNGKMTLREALKKTRSNGVARKSRKSRSNPSKSLRDLLKSRANGVVRQSRSNPLNRAQLTTEIQALGTSYEQARRKYAANPTAQNKIILDQYRSMMKEAKRDFDRLAASAKRTPARKASTRKSSTRKASTRKSSTRKSSTRKSSASKSASKKTESGVANLTAAYKRLRKSGTKSKFTRAFNVAFKKAKRSGKSAATAQRSAISAGRKATSARKNPSSTKRAVSALASAAKATRSNPRKKRKTSTSKRRTSAAKPRTSAAISAHGRKSKQYRSLRSKTKKSAFLREFKKAFTAQNRKRGVTEAQAAARAALIANAKVNSAARSRKNPAPMKAVTRMNPRKKTTRKSSRKASSRKPSKRAASLEALAKKSALYKRLKTASVKKAFIAHFKTSYAKIARKASSQAQAVARTAMGAYGKVTKGNTRKNPSCGTRMNPRKKSTTRRRTSSSTKRARGQRLKRGMSKSAKQALSVAGIYTYKITMGGKVHTIRADKSSSVYKSAKRGGLKAVKLTKLKGKKNTPTSLNLRTVYKVVDGRPSKKDFQRCVNAWAGAIDGGKVRGVSKRDIARTRMNPAKRKHTVNAISNPMPMSVASQMQRFNSERSGGDKVKLVAIGLGATYATSQASNALSAILGRDWLLNVTESDIKEKRANYLASEALPPLLFGLTGGVALYQKFVAKRDVSDAMTALSTGLVAGSVASALSRTIVKGMSKFIPGFKSVSNYAGDSLTFKEESEKAAVASGYLLDSQSNLGATMSKLHNNGLGVYVTDNNLGRYVSTPNMGRYVSTPVANVDGLGVYVEESSARSNPAQRLFGLGAEDRADRLFGVLRSNPANGGISPVGANVQDVPNRAPAVPDGVYEIDSSTLREDLQLIEPLTNAELDAEGLTEVYSSGDQLPVIRAVPDVARQVVESNFGSIIGPSRVIQGTVLVLASIFDSPQAPVLTDRLRLDRAPEVPKGASFPAPGGVFSRVAFSSVLPSINNQASYQEFGVKIR